MKSPVVLGKESIFTDRTDIEQATAHRFSVTKFTCDFFGCTMSTVFQFTVGDDVADMRLRSRDWQMIGTDTFCPAHHQPVATEASSQEQALADDPVIFHDDLGGGPAPEIPEPTAPKKTRPSRSTDAAIAVTALVIGALAIISEWAVFRMLGDEQSIMITKSQEFETRLAIEHSNCDWGMFKFTCSGILPSATSPSIPVRYACDRQTCAFECGK